jgi:IS30 family transposase
LRESGVEVRHPRVSAGDSSQAVAWYRQGVRQIDIAERLGRHKSAVWHLLRRAGAL